MEITQSMRQEYRLADPFPHIIIDNLFDSATLNDVEREIRSTPQSVWDENCDPTSGFMKSVQRGKSALKDVKLLGPKTTEMLKLFTSVEMRKSLEELTGIPDLEPDPDFLGGGVHRIDKGGKLSIHGDFNMHPETGKHRRLNALLYLNPKWKKGDQGELELWDDEMTECTKSIPPLHNRLVIFTITDEAYHGHPEPWLGEEYRLSLALYYYTKDRPEYEKSPFHWANWKSRPGKGW